MDKEGVVTTEERMYWRFIDALRDELIAGYLEEGYSEEEAEKKATEWLKPEIKELHNIFMTGKKMK